MNDLGDVKGFLAVVMDGVREDGDCPQTRIFEITDNGLLNLAILGEPCGTRYDNADILPAGPDSAVTLSGILLCAIGDISLIPLEIIGERVKDYIPGFGVNYALKRNFQGRQDLEFFVAEMVVQ